MPGSLMYVALDACANLYFSSDLYTRRAWIAKADRWLLASPAMAVHILQ